MNIISIINYKGGVGKTTLTTNIAGDLAQLGHNVLMIDLDPQASLTFSFLKPDEWKEKVADKHTIKNWFSDSKKVRVEKFEDLSVDVHNPEMTLSVEIRDKIYVYSETLPGTGGMPIGTNGKAMLLLSGGIDSPVAGYMIAKRGVKIEAVYFHAPPYTSERAKKKVVDLAKKVAVYSGELRLHVINFTEIQMAIYEKCPHDELTIIMRRYMMKIAEKLAVHQKCSALITGESVGQVASQTIYALGCTDQATALPVFRPCIGMDKDEIIKISREIDTFETSILPYEDCCTVFTPKHPKTRPQIEDILKAEEALDSEALIERAVKGARKTVIH